MGHLFRMLRFASFLRAKGEAIIFFVNSHAPSLALLDSKKFDYHTVDLNDEGDWEQRLIQQYGIEVWVNDRLSTSYQHALYVKKLDIKLITLEDRGAGAKLADLHVAALFFDDVDSLQGGKVLSGYDYLILDEEINRFRRLRTAINKILVSMGGSDTYGVTLQVIDALKESLMPVTVVVGPGFEHMEQLKQMIPDHFDLRVNVSSLMETFAEFDLLFTAGGVTPFEACASGLPCVSVATELFEIPVGRQLEKMGVGVFAGHYSEMKKVTVEQIEIEKMSKQAMLSVDTKGAERVYEEIMAL